MGTIIGLNYDGEAGALQTVIMMPSTTRPPKPIAPRSPVFGAGISWEDIVAEVESKFMLPPSMAETSSRPKKPHFNDL